MNFYQFENKHDVRVGDQIHLSADGIRHVNRLLRLVNFRKMAIEGKLAVYGKRGLWGLCHWLLVYTDKEKLVPLLVGRRHKIIEDKDPIIPMPNDYDQ